ncbi:MAG: hypothetical protein GXY36_03215 [Chloroflexi bacterium]|nr:hypothetical protein [Chloroflexota bacterium]
MIKLPGPGNIPPLPPLGNNPLYPFLQQQGFREEDVRPMRYFLIVVQAPDSDLEVVHDRLREFGDRCVTLKSAFFLRSDIELEKIKEGMQGILPNAPYLIVETTTNWIVHQGENCLDIK